MEIDEISVKNIVIDTGGEIQLDESGRPNGIFTEGATTFVLEKVPMPSQDKFKKAIVTLKAFCMDQKSCKDCPCGSKYFCIFDKPICDWNINQIEEYMKENNG